MARTVSFRRLHRNFFAFIMISLLIFALLKMATRRLQSPTKPGSPAENLKTLACAIAKYGIDNNGKIPKRLSELYPQYCSDLSAFTSPMSRPISDPGVIDRESSFQLNPKLPARFEDIHLRGSLILLSDTAEEHKSGVTYIINANLEVVPLTERSRNTLGITAEPAKLTESEIDEDGDGRIDERRFFSNGKLTYSMELLYNKDGRLVRETWYDSEGEITGEYGPGFRMYNYDKEGRLTLISNHFYDGTPAEVFGVASVRIQYASDRATVTYLAADGSILTTLRNPVKTNSETP